MICYITDSNGTVVAQFDGRSPNVKDRHNKHQVDTIDDLPGVEQWDEHYLQA